MRKNPAHLLLRPSLCEQDGVPVFANITKTTTIKG